MCFFLREPLKAGAPGILIQAFGVVIWLRILLGLRTLHAMLCHAAMRYVMTQTESLRVRVYCLPCTSLL